MIQVLNETSWHKKRAADILGINPSTLYRKIKSYGLEGPAGSGHEFADAMFEEAETVEA